VRHLSGIALAVGLTLVMFFGAGWGYLQLLRLPAKALSASGGSLFSDHTALLALIALVGTGLLAGLLASVPWFSPLASGLPGLLLLAWTGLFLVRTQQAVTLAPLRSLAFGTGWDALLSNGVLGAVGAVMVLPLFVPSRWRARPGTVRSRDLSDVDNYLASVTAKVPAMASTAPPSAPPATAGSPAAAKPAPLPKREKPDDEPPLVGTVLPRRADWPADAMRITDANQAPRDAGSFSATDTPDDRSEGGSDGVLHRNPYRN
jgi:hypothetical protein